MSSSPTVRVRIEDRIAHLTIDRPPLNILDLDTIAQLDRALADLGGKAADLRLLLVRGGGGKAFSAGVAVEDHTPDKVDELLDRFHGALGRIRDFPAPTLAAVRGHCLGGGMELAAVCDLVVATESSKFGQPEIRLGCFPPVAAALYPSLLGSQAAFDLVLTGRTIDAAEAYRLGFLGRPPTHDGALEDVVIEIVEALSAHSAAVLRLTKAAISAGRRMPYAEALAEAERIYRADLVGTEDMAEGLAAFLEKRSPRWNHR